MRGCAQAAQSGQINQKRPVENFPGTGGKLGRHKTSIEGFLGRTGLVARGGAEAWGSRAPLYPCSSGVIALRELRSSCNFAFTGVRKCRIREL